MLLKKKKEKKSVTDTEKVSLSRMILKYNSAYV